MDDLGVVDAAQIPRRDPEIGMPELALYDEQTGHPRGTSRRRWACRSSAGLWLKLLPGVTLTDEDWRDNAFWGLPVDAPQPAFTPEARRLRTTTEVRDQVLGVLQRPGVRYADQELSDGQQRQIARTVRRAQTHLSAVREASALPSLVLGLLITAPVCGLTAINILVLPDSLGLGVRVAISAGLGVAQLFIGLCVGMLWATVSLGVPHDHPFKVVTDPGELVAFGRYVIPGAVLACGTAALAIAINVRHLGWFGAVALSFPLACLWFEMCFMVYAGLHYAAKVLRVPANPYAQLMVDLFRLADDSYWVCAQAPGLDWATRRALAGSIEEVASAVERRSFCSSVEFVFGSQTLNDVARANSRTAAWLRQLETSVLVSPDGAGRQITSELERGALAGGLGDWETLQTDARERPRLRWFRRFAPRAALALTIGAAAWLVPVALSRSLSTEAANAMRVTLIVAALTALVTPSEAVQNATESIGALTGR